MLTEEKIISLSEKIDKNTILHKYLCPISHDIMSDPVLISSGHVYNRTHIEEWLEKQDIDPETREEVDKITFPVHYLKREILEYLENI